MSWQAIAVGICVGMCAQAVLRFLGGAIVSAVTLNLLEANASFRAIVHKRNQRKQRIKWLIGIAPTKRSA